MATNQAAGAPAFAVTLDSAARNPHQPALGVVGAIVAILNGGATELREGDDNKVLPLHFAGIQCEVFAKPVESPGDPTLQIGVVASDTALIVVGVEAAHFRASDNGVSMVQDERSALKLLEEALGPGIYNIGRLGSASVLGNGRREEVIMGGVPAPAVAGNIIHERIVVFAERD